MIAYYYVLGMEPYTAHVRWYPAKDTHPNRNVEGTYLLHSLPDILNGEYHSYFSAFAEKCSKVCQKALKEIQQYFANDVKVLEAWETWSERYAPMTDDVTR